MGRHGGMGEKRVPKLENKLKATHSYTRNGQSWDILELVRKRNGKKWKDSYNGQDIGTGGSYLIDVSTYKGMQRLEDKALIYSQNKDDLTAKVKELNNWQESKLGV